MKSMARKRSLEQSTSVGVMENPTQPVGVMNPIQHAVVMENPTQPSKKPI